MLILTLIVATLHQVTPDCNAAPKDPIVTVEVPGGPFQALPSTDGCWVFVSIPGGASGNQSMIALYRRSDGALSLVRTLPIEGGPTGMALTHDGKTLVIADGDRVAFVDAHRLTRGSDDAILGYLRDSTAKGRVYASITTDDKFAFIADENSKTVSIIDMARARATHYDAAAIVGKIPTGALPIALTFSRDGKLIYISPVSSRPLVGHGDQETIDTGALVRTGACAKPRPR